MFIYKLLGYIATIRYTIFLKEERMNNHIEQLKNDFQTLSEELHSLKKEILEVLESLNT